MEPKTRLGLYFLALIPFLSTVPAYAANALSIFLTGAEFQAETDHQRAVARQALEDMLRLPAKQLARKRYADDEGKPEQWTARQVLLRRFVPGKPDGLPEGFFYRLAARPEARAALGRALQALDCAVAPPSNVRGERQDAQAARVTWDRVPEAVGYRFYASRDRNPPDFYQENKHPLNQEFAIWDAPRDGPRRFLFFVTSVDKNGRESFPSAWVAVSLDRNAVHGKRR